MFNVDGTVRHDARVDYENKWKVLLCLHYARHHRFCKLQSACNLSNCLHLCGLLCTFCHCYSLPSIGSTQFHTCYMAPDIWLIFLY